jgi:hypothetical protein
VKIDWESIEPTAELRDAIDTTLEPSRDLVGETLLFRRLGEEYEVQILPRVPERPMTLRVRGDDLVQIAGRAAALLRSLAVHHGRRPA